MAPDGRHRVPVSDGEAWCSECVVGEGRGGLAALVQHAGPSTHLTSGQPFGRRFLVALSGDDGLVKCETLDKLTFPRADSHLLGARLGVPKAFPAAWGATVMLGRCRGWR